jgi:hypothetical protein
MNAWFKRGSTSCASMTTALRLSGMSTRNTPPKNPQAASQPAITSSTRCPKLSHTNECRL